MDARPDTRLRVTGTADIRPSEWTRLANEKPRCPACGTGMPLQFEPRVEAFGRSISRMAAGPAIRPTEGRAGEAWYYQTHLHKQCKRVIEIRQRDPALAAVDRLAA